jgi:hypothetical protein
MTLSQESAQQHQKVAACFTQFQQLDQRANNLISLIEISNEQQGALDWYIEELRTQQTQLIQLSWKYHEYAKKVAGLLAQYQKNIIELHLSSQKLKTVNPIEVELSHQLCETFRARLDQLDYTYQKLRIPTESPTGFSTDGTNAETAYHEACASMIVTQG